MLRGVIAPSLREAMSHAQTGLVPADGSLLTIGWEQDRMHTANAATVTSRETACDLSIWLFDIFEPCADRKDSFYYEKKM